MPCPLPGCQAGLVPYPYGLIPFILNPHFSRDFDKYIDNSMVQNVLCTIFQFTSFDRLFSARICGCLRGRRSYLPQAYTYIG